MGVAFFIVFLNITDLTASNGAMSVPLGDDQRRLSPSVNSHRVLPSCLHVEKLLQ